MHVTHMLLNFVTGVDLAIASWRPIRVAMAASLHTSLPPLVLHPRLCLGPVSCIKLLCIQLLNASCMLHVQYYSVVCGVSRPPCMNIIIHIYLVAMLHGVVTLVLYVAYTCWHQPTCNCCYLLQLKLCFVMGVQCTHTVSPSCAAACS